jgi:hypothetical protein
MVEMTTDEEEYVILNMFDVDTPIKIGTVIKKLTLLISEIEKEDGADDDSKSLLKTAKSMLKKLDRITLYSDIWIIFYISSTDF